MAKETRWADWKAAQRAIPASKCARCGTTQNLVRHHVDKNTSNRAGTNIRVLCHQHHALAHYPAGKS